MQIKGKPKLDQVEEILWRRWGLSWMRMTKGEGNFFDRARVCAKVLGPGMKKQ